MLTGKKRANARRATCLASIVALVILNGFAATRAFAQAGTWTALPFDNVAASSHRNTVLLTDGTLLAQAEANGHVWSRFTPDAAGNYTTGTWSTAASSQIDRRYFPYAVLRDGRVFISGGEFLGANETNTNAVEIYNPLMNSWTAGPDGLFGDIGDVPYQVLADGRIIVGFRFGNQAQIFDPVTTTWTQTGSKPLGIGTEETWSLLPNGTVLNWTSPQPYRWLPSTGQWINDAVPPTVMQNTADAEVGAGVFLYTGKLLAISAFGRTALYTSAENINAAGSWALGPSVPPPTVANGNPNGSQWMEDNPACIEVNGKVLIVSTDQIFGPLTSMSEYDPATNTITPVASPPLPFGWPAFALNFVALPNGQVMLTGTGTTDFVWTSVGGPQNVWRPTISSITANANGTFTLTGTQLNGLSQGASYGDEGNAQTNYPLVRFTSGSTVRYARTFNHSTMGFATASTPVSTTFTLPPGIPSGTYQVAAVANGIASNPVNLTIVNNQVSAMLQIYDQWATGYCTNVTVTNNKPTAISSWTVVFNLGNATFNAQWNAIYTQNGSTLTAVNRNFNGNLAPGASTQFGFCTQGPTPVSTPIITSSTGS